MTLANSPLGKRSPYIDTYTPSLLFPILRSQNRQKLNITSSLPFKGEDIWHAYEISWLDKYGKPCVALGEFIVPCNTPFLIESKSFKLYLNSFNQSQFDSLNEVANRLQQDLSQAAGDNIQMTLSTIKSASIAMAPSFDSICLDSLPVHCDHYDAPQPHYLQTQNELAQERVYSDLLKSNCLVTGQPDWASIEISYSGPRISHESLLKYLISFRQHQGFHEDCVEKIFMDILTHCQPSLLSVEAHYTRRGGLDINPFRTNDVNFVPNHKRFYRQ